jgi:hypothetical protein
LKKAKAERALSVLSDNLKRVINIEGVHLLLKPSGPSPHKKNSCPIPSRFPATGIA